VDVNWATYGALLGEQMMVLDEALALEERGEDPARVDELIARSKRLRAELETLRREDG
jgi:hypothetical protein